MRIAHFLYIVLLFPLTCVCGGNVNEETKIPLSLCDSGDSVYFSCGVKKEKTISLCGGDIESKNSYIYYRFGKPNKIELEYPKGRNKDSIAKFSYLKHSRSQLEDLTVSFLRNDYEYSVYSYYNGEDNAEKPTVAYGVTVGKVNRTDKKRVDIECASELINNLFVTTEFLSCGSDDPFFCDTKFDEYGNSITRNR